MTSSFEAVGLTYYEAKMLEELFSGPRTIKEISRSARIPPGKVYSVAKALRSQGLISESSSRPKLLSIDDPSRVIAQLIERKSDDDERLFASLRSRALDAARSRGERSQFFEFGTTLFENERIQLRSFREAKREVLQVLPSQHAPRANRASKGRWEQEIADAVRRGVRFRAIYGAATPLPSALARLPPERFSVRRLDVPGWRFDVIDEKKALLKLVHEDTTLFGGVLFLENERFARHLAGVFEKLWREAR